MKQRIKSFIGITACIFVGIAPTVYSDWFSRKENQRSAWERFEEFSINKEQTINHREEDIINMFEDVYRFFKENN